MPKLNISYFSITLLCLTIMALLVIQMDHWNINDTITTSKTITQVTAQDTFQNMIRALHSYSLILHGFQDHNTQSFQCSISSNVFLLFFKYAIFLWPISVIILDWWSATIILRMIKTTHHSCGSTIWRLHYFWSMRLGIIVQTLIGEFFWNQSAMKNWVASGIHKLESIRLHMHFHGEAVSKNGL